jgi:hypothetical protein
MAIHRVTTNAPERFNKYRTCPPFSSAAFTA